MSAEQIRRELEAAKKHYELDFLKKCESKLRKDLQKKFTKDYRLEKVELPALTVANVAKVEAMIRADSKYTPNDYFRNDKYIPRLMKEFGEHLKHPDNDKGFDAVVEKVVERIDIENSTHLTADCNDSYLHKNARGEMEDRIKKYKDDILPYLENPGSCRGINLVKELSEPTVGLKERRHLSFASKFCHYACFYIFEGEDAQDNFSIYDSIVAKILPYYLDYYQNKIKLKKEFKPASKDYEIYSEAIGAVIKASGSRISRHGFDHLVWYYFKDKKRPKKQKNDE